MSGLRNAVGTTAQRHDLLEQGLGLRAVALQTGLALNTVWRYARAGSWEELAAGRWQNLLRHL